MTKQMIVILILFVYVFVRSVFIEPHSLVVTEYKIESQELAGLRIAFLSDIHLKKHDSGRLSAIIRKTNRQKPDIVLFGGDFANGEDISDTISPFIFAPKLEELNAPSYAVLGTEDIIAGKKEYKDALNLNGVQVLENESKEIHANGKKFYLIGIADIKKDIPNVAQAFSGTKTPRIVLSHNPDIYYDIIEETSLVLAGHTHGGQFIFPFTPPLFVDSKYGIEFAGGKTGREQSPMIVSRGIGTSVLPLRFNCPPEIVIVDFVKVGEGKKK